MSGQIAPNPPQGTIQPLAGTSSDNYSIGEGNNQVDIATIQGRVYIRQFGQGYRQVAFADQVGALSIQQWAPSTQFTVDEVIIYNGTLYLTTVTHTSGVSFDPTKFDLLAAYDGFTAISGANGITVNLTPAQGQFVWITGGGAPGSMTIVLPDATLLKLGHSLKLQNDSVHSIVIKDFSGTTLDTLPAANAADYVYAQAAGPAGTWTIRRYLSNQLFLKIVNYPQIFDWVSSTAYVVDQVVVSSNQIYKCALNHTSGVFLTDLANAKWVPISGASAGGGFASVNVTQTGHGLIVGNPVTFNGSAWVKAQADTNDNVAIGIVSAVSGSTFTVMLTGGITLTTGQWDVVTGLVGGLVPGDIYFTSDATAGMLTSVEPALSNPMIKAISNTTAVAITQYRPQDSGVGNTVIEQEFTATQGQTSFTLNKMPAGKPFVWVFVGGVPQSPSTYTLNGSVVTFNSPLSQGTQVYIKAIISTVFNTDLSQFANRLIVGLNNGQNYSLGGASGIYEIFDQLDPKNTKCIVDFTAGDSTPYILVNFGALVSDVANNPSTFNIYVSLGNLIVQNQLGSSKTFIVYKRT